jgi:hypothetical protein
MYAQKLVADMTARYGDLTDETNSVADYAQKNCGVSLEQ